MLGPTKRGPESTIVVLRHLREGRIVNEWVDALDLRAAPPPRFCPRCGRGAEHTSNLCANCGEVLADQGYCAVCEGFRAQRLGEPCAKHEVPLDAGPSAPAATAGGARVDWVTLAAFPQSAGAGAARIRLEAEGIPTFLEGERMGNQGAFQIATGGVRLQVPRELADEARIVLSQTWTPGEDEDLDDAWEDLEPAPGSRRRAIMKGVIIFILLQPLIYFVVLRLTMN